MKIISEITGKEYKSVQECEQAEKAFLLKQKLEKEEKENYLKKVDEEKNKLATISAQKKELANKVEAENDKLDKAYEKYTEAKKQAREIVEEANKKARELLEPIEKEIRDCKTAKYNALMDFNKQFGAYNVKYTGEKAEKEYNRFLRERDDIWNNFFGKNIFDDFFKLF